MPFLTWCRRARKSWRKEQEYLQACAERACAVAGSHGRKAPFPSAAEFAVNAASYCHYGLIELEISSRQHQTGNWNSCSRCRTPGGISQEDLAHIFDPFFQTRHSLSIGGLGLHVAWTIAQKMGGSLTASSELGTGSCFLFAVSVTASVPELPNERYCVTDSGADCEWMQDADFPDVPPDFCQRILELIDMGAVSEIDELLDYLYAKEMISPTLFLALKQDNAQLHFDRIAQICGGSRRRISSD